MKIAVMGYSGAGKSTLARKLGKIYNAEVLHLDTVHFQSGWVEREFSQKQRLVEEFLDSHHCYVIDGNYSKLFYERRVGEADMILLLLYNRFSCLFRVIKRYRTYKNKTRPDMTEGCEEKLDREFVKWVLYEQRSKAAKERYRKLQKEFPQKTFVIRNNRQLRRFLDSLHK